MQLIFDFDGTITQQDTISELASAAIAFQHAQRGQDLRATWDQVVQDYLSDYQHHKENYQPKDEERREVAQEITFLNSLQPIEQASLRRVQASGVFDGLEQMGLFEMGVSAIESKKIKIREGFKELTKLAERNGWGLGVISVNWSRSFIRGVLHQFSIPIVANEVSSDGRICGPDFLDEQLTNSAGKLSALKHEFRAGDESILYFGDSPTDLECLLAHKGLVISSNVDSTLMRTMRRLSIPVQHVETYNKEANNSVYWAMDFQEVIGSGLLDQ
jgi:2-hydroxy-3-keto-5-methylthiopentenyl-1-phosphate phosphatase